MSNEMTENRKILQELRDKILKRSLLAIDDDSNFLELLSSSLEDTIKSSRGDIELKCVDNGNHAINLLKSGYKPDTIILDIMMPGMDGIETLKEIRKIYSDLNVIVLTGMEEERIKQLPEYGIVRVIRKPDSYEGLVQLKGAFLSA